MSCGVVIKKNVTYLSAKNNHKSLSECIDLANSGTKEPCPKFLGRNQDKIVLSRAIVTKRQFPNKFIQENRGKKTQKYNFDIYQTSFLAALMRECIANNLNALKATKCQMSKALFQFLDKCFLNHVVTINECLRVDLYFKHHIDFNQKFLCLPNHLGETFPMSSIHTF